MPNPNQATAAIAGRITRSVYLRKGAHAPNLQGPRAAANSTSQRDRDNHCAMSTAGDMKPLPGNVKTNINTAESSIRACGSHTNT